MIGRHTRIAYADALRTLAILSVVVCHVMVVLPHTSGSFEAKVEDIGGWGVGTFFVLTGFLLSRPYIEAILDPERRNFPSIRLFFRRRFYRIFPLYAFAVVITGAGGLIHGQHLVTILNILAHLFFLQGFIPTYAGAPFGPLWTMAVDAEFYLLLPILAFVLHAGTKHLTFNARLRVIVVSLLIAFFVGLAWRYWCAKTEPLVFSDFNVSLVLVRNVIGMSPSFALGIGLALLEVLHFKPSQSACNLALLFGLCLIVAFIAISIFSSRLLSLIIGDFVAGASAVLLLGGLIEGRFNAVVRIARSAVMSRLAALSYSIYLFHKPVIVAVHEFLLTRGVFHLPFGFPAFVLISLVSVTVAALFGHRFVEAPFLNVRDKNREVPTELPEAPFAKNLSVT